MSGYGQPEGNAGVFPEKSCSDVGRIVPISPRNRHSAAVHPRSATGVPATNAHAPNRRIHRCRRLWGVTQPAKFIRSGEPPVRKARHSSGLGPCGPWSEFTVLRGAALSALDGLPPGALRRAGHFACFTSLIVEGLETCDMDRETVIKYVRDWRPASRRDRVLRQINAMVGQQIESSEGLYRLTQPQGDGHLIVRDKRMDTLRSSSKTARA